MREIEFIRTDKTNLEIDQYFEKLLKEVGFKVVFFTFSDHPISPSSPLILLPGLSWETFLPEIQKIISFRKEKFIIALNSKTDFKIISELKFHYDKIFGFIDITQEIEYNIPILTNYFKIISPAISPTLDQLAIDLEKINDHTQNTLEKIKELHDRFVKLRVDSFKGITITSKFMSGETSGGEFFEILKNDQELFYIQASSNSYFLSSIILSEIDTLKETITAANLNDKIEQFKVIMNHHANKNNAEFTYVIMNLNLKTFQTTFTVQGQGHIFFRNEFIIFDKEMKLKLRPKERLCILSQGALNNWKKFNHLLSAQTLNIFLTTNTNLKTRDLINEFFFELSRHKVGNFLIYDALWSVVEIEENTLYQL